MIYHESHKPTWAYVIRNSYALLSKKVSERNSFQLMVICRAAQAK